MVNSSALAETFPPNIQLRSISSNDDSNKKISPEEMRYIVPSSFVKEWLAFTHFRTRPVPPTHANNKLLVNYNKKTRNYQAKQNLQSNVHFRHINYKTWALYKTYYPNSSPEIKSLFRDVTDPTKWIIENEHRTAYMRTKSALLRTLNRFKLQRNKRQLLHDGEQPEGTNTANSLRTMHVDSDGMLFQLSNSVFNREQILELVVCLSDSTTPARSSNNNHIVEANFASHFLQYSLGLTSVHPGNCNNYFLLDQIIEHDSWAKKQTLSERSYIIVSERCYSLICFFLPGSGPRIKVASTKEWEIDNFAGSEEEAVINPAVARLMACRSSKNLEAGNLEQEIKIEQKVEEARLIAGKLLASNLAELRHKELLEEQQEDARLEKEVREEEARLMAEKLLQSNLAELRHKEMLKKQQEDARLEKEVREEEARLLAEKLLQSNLAELRHKEMLKKQQEEELLEKEASEAEALLAASAVLSSSLGQRRKSEVEKMQKIIDEEVQQEILSTLLLDKEREKESKPKDAARKIQCFMKAGVARIKKRRKREKLEMELLKAKEIWAAGKMQQAYRSLLAKRKLASMKEERRIKLIELQRAKEVWAATKLQAVYRTRLARKRVNELKEERLRLRREVASLRIQNFWRRIRAKLGLVRNKNAVGKISALWRGKAGRADFVAKRRGADKIASCMRRLAAQKEVCKVKRCALDVPISVKVISLSNLQENGEGGGGGDGRDTVGSVGMGRMSLRQSVTGLVKKGTGDRMSNIRVYVSCFTKGMDRTTSSTKTSKKRGTRDPIYEERLDLCGDGFNGESKLVFTVVAHSKIGAHRFLGQGMLDLNKVLPDGYFAPGNEKTVTCENVELKRYKIPQGDFSQGFSDGGVVMSLNNTESPGCGSLTLVCLPNDSKVTICGWLSMQLVTTGSKLKWGGGNDVVRWETKYCCLAGGVLRIHNSPYRLHETQLTISKEEGGEGVELEVIEQIMEVIKRNSRAEEKEAEKEQKIKEISLKFGKGSGVKLRIVQTRDETWRVDEMNWVRKLRTVFDTN